jgi:hypothetical protein
MFVSAQRQRANDERRVQAKLNGIEAKPHRLNRIVTLLSVVFASVAWCSLYLIRR